jgi:hypothetical protein
MLQRSVHPQKTFPYCNDPFSKPAPGDEKFLRASASSSLLREKGNVDVKACPNQSPDPELFFKCL